MITSLVFTLTALLIGFGYFAGSELVSQSRMLGDRLGEMRTSVTERIPPGLLELLPKSAGNESGGTLGGYAARLGTALANGVMSMTTAAESASSVQWIVSVSGWRAPRREPPLLNSNTSSR